MNEKIQMKIRMDVVGVEGFDIEVNYKDTDLKTVVLIQKALLDTFKRILDAQKV